MSSLGAALASPLIVAAQQNKAMPQDKLDAAADVLAKAVADGQVDAAAMCVRHRGQEFARSFGAAKTPDGIFLLASISKPISVAALMTLYDQGKFALDDPVKKFLPEFSGGPRDQITIEQLLTHVSGLPDQLPENESLRKGNAPLSEFVDLSFRTPLLFEPGTQYRYSSMGILLASEIAQRITGRDFKQFVADAVFKPLDMQYSALGVGQFKPEQLLRCQTEKAAPESGGGDPAAKNWDWNSPYWRAPGAPGAARTASATDVARFLAEFLHPSGKALKPETAALVVQNHNRAGLTPRGLGFAVGAKAGGAGSSEKTFGHGGATGTLSWADPATDTICVVLTTLPDKAANPHPTRLVSDLVAGA